MNLIIILIILGLVFTLFEVIVPGGILGILAAIAIIWASVLTFQNYGIIEALSVLVGSLVLIVTLVIFELKIISKTKLGKRMFLDKAVDAQSTQVLGNESLIGKKGQAETTLAPSGKIIVEGVEYEAFSEDGLIKDGEAVQIVGRDNFRVVVKKI